MQRYRFFINLPFLGKHCFLNFVKYNVVKQYAEGEKKCESNYRLQGLATPCL